MAETLAEALGRIKGAEETFTNLLEVKDALIEACEILARAASACTCGEPIDHEELCPLYPSSAFRAALSAAAQRLGESKGGE